MAWNNTVEISRKNEILYYNLIIEDKIEYLVHKYFSPSKWLKLYSVYSPNVKEFSNNAFWRLNSDIFLNHYYTGVTDPFVKEPAYAVFSLFPIATASILGLPIGSSNNTYSFVHVFYAALRAVGKFVPMIIHYDKKDIPGALDIPVKKALYFTDTICRWLPYANERLQSDSKADVYSLGFYITSVLSGIARTKGSEIASPYAKGAQDIVNNVLDNVILDPLGINIDGTTLSKMNAIKEMIFGASIDNTVVKQVEVTEPILAQISERAKVLIDKIPAMPSIVIEVYEYAAHSLSEVVSPVIYVYEQTTGMSNDAIKYISSPVIEVVRPYIPGIFKRSSNEKITLDHTSQKAIIFLTGSIVFDLVKFISTNFVSTMLLVPSSRIMGIFAEEVSELTIDIATKINDILLGKAVKFPEYNYPIDSFQSQQECIGKSCLGVDDEL